MSYLTLHICEHARLIHTQTFCHCTDVRTSTMFLIPRYNLSEVITEEQALIYLAILQARTTAPINSPGI
jgi:hypothetical protein